MPKIRMARIKDVKLPTRGTKGSAGIDFYVPNGEDLFYEIPPYKDVLIPSGIRVLVPEGKALIAFNKSGIATKKKLVVGACVVDSDYTGEIHIHLMNTCDDFVFLYPGDKVAQFLLLDVDHGDIQEWESAEELFEGFETERGSGAFGSTGD